MTVWKRGSIVLGLVACLGLWACVRLMEPGVVEPRPSVQGGTPEGDAVPVEAAKGSAASVPSPPEVERAAVGRRYLDFVGQRLGGGQLRLSDVVGPKAVVLQFWGVRCSPCLAEMAFLSEMQTLHAQGLQVIGVNTDRAPEVQLRQALGSRAIAPAFPLITDPDFSISGRYTQWLVPVSVLIDRKGVVRAIHTGYNAQLSATLRTEIEGILTEE